MEKCITTKENKKKSSSLKATKHSKCELFFLWFLLIRNSAFYSHIPINCAFFSLFAFSLIPFGTTSNDQTTITKIVNGFSNEKQRTNSQHKRAKKICFVLTFVCIFYLLYTLFASFFPFNCKMQNVHCFTQPMTARRKNRDVDDEKLFRSARRFEKIYFCACAEFHVQRWTIASKTSF